jgi:hypothetical protein
MSNKLARLHRDCSGQLPVRTGMGMLPAPVWCLDEPPSDLASGALPWSCSCMGVKLRQLAEAGTALECATATSRRSFMEIDDSSFSRRQEPVRRLRGDATSQPRWGL